MSLEFRPSPRRGAVARGCLIGIGVVVLFAVVFGGCSVALYNGIATSRETVNAKLGEIDNMYKRRNDLVPQLVETVKGSANFEKTTLQSVVDARASVGRVQLPANAATDEKAMQEYLRAQQGMSGALTHLFAVAEAYPDLKASKNFLDLQTQLEGNENRIAVARTDYIEAVNTYNTKLVRFPASLFASVFNFEKLPQFQADSSERKAPDVKFDFSEKK